MRIVTEAVTRTISLAVIGYKTGIAEIDRCVKPFVNHVDNIILGNGKFDFYEDDEPDNAEWVKYVQEKYGDKVNIVTYEHSGKQIEKRQIYNEIAGNLGTDFLIVMDTDDYVVPEKTNWELFYKNLIKVSRVLPDRVFMLWEYIPDDRLWPKQGNMFASNAWRRSARIFKDPAGIKFCMDCHYMWCDKMVNEDEMIKWQLEHRDADNPYQYVGRVPIDGLRITMDRTLRTDEQIKKGAYWAFMNQPADNSRQYYKTAKLMGYKVPEGFESWEEFENAPHTFDQDGVRVDLREKKEEEVNQP